jgi:hypothetical protein
MFFSCKNANSNVQSLKLVLETKELKSGKNHNGTNVVKYSITNNSNDIFYINNFTEKIKLPFGITKNGKYLKVFQENKESKYYPIFIKPTDEKLNCDILNDNQKRIDSKNLGYNDVLIYDMLELDKFNFFIYPNQTLYFEYYVSIDKSISESKQSSIVSIDYTSNKNYYATLSIASDSSNYRKILPRNILKTIEKNNIKVYHGVLESENKVSIKISD